MGGTRGSGVVSSAYDVVRVVLGVVGRYTGILSQGLRVGVVLDLCML